MFRSCWTARRNADETGITDEELKKFCVQCSRCENIVSRTSHAWHECPNLQGNSSSHNTPKCATEEDQDIFEEEEYRLDAIGKGHFLHGLTAGEFEGYFSKCVCCERFLTKYGRDRHICSESIMMESLACVDDKFVAEADK